MDENALLLLRLIGYLLNAAIFALAAVKFRHHFPVLGAWVFWILVVIVAVFFQLSGDKDTYTLIVNYVVMVLLYANAVIGAWVLLKHEPKGKEK